MTSTEKQLKDKDGNDITDTNAVHKTGNETIEGIKTFTRQVQSNGFLATNAIDQTPFNKKCTDIDITATSSENKYIAIATFRDQNAVKIGGLTFIKTTTGKIQLQASLRNIDGTEKSIILAESD